MTFPLQKDISLNPTLNFQVMTQESRLSPNYILFHERDSSRVCVRVYLSSRLLIFEGVLCLDGKKMERRISLHWKRGWIFCSHGVMDLHLIGSWELIANCFRLCICCRDTCSVYCTSWIFTWCLLLQRIIKRSATEEKNSNALLSVYKVFFPPDTVGWPYDDPTITGPLDHPRCTLFIQIRPPVGIILCWVLTR